MIELNEENIAALIDTYDDLALAVREIAEEDTAEDVAVIDHWWYDLQLQCFAILVEVENDLMRYGSYVSVEYVPYQDAINRMEENRKNRL